LIPWFEPPALHVGPITIQAFGVLAALGVAAGVRTAAALWGPFSRQDLEAGEPDHWLEQPEDLLDIL